jgi:hypothetical protein
MQQDSLTIFNIFTYLDAKDIALSASLVCKQWFVLSTQSYHWSRLAIKRFGLEFKLPKLKNLSNRHYTKTKDQELTLINNCTNWYKYYKERIEFQLGTPYRLDMIDRLLRRYRVYNHPAFMKQIVYWSNLELHKADDTFYDTWIQVLLQNEDEALWANAVFRFLKPCINMIKYTREDTSTSTEIQSEARMYLNNITIVPRSLLATASTNEGYDACMYLTIRFDFEEIRMEKRIGNSTIDSEINLELSMDVEYMNEEHFERKALFTWEGYRNIDRNLECQKKKIRTSELGWILSKVIPEIQSQEDTDLLAVMDEGLLLQFLMVRLSGSPDAMIL